MPTALYGGFETGGSQCAGMIGTGPDDIWAEVRFPPPLQQKRWLRL